MYLHEYARFKTDAPANKHTVHSNWLMTHSHSAKVNLQCHRAHHTRTRTLHTTGNQNLINCCPLGFSLADYQHWHLHRWLLSKKVGTSKKYIWYVLCSNRFLLSMRMQQQVIWFTARVPVLAVCVILGLLFRWATKADTKKKEVKKTMQTYMYVCMQIHT